MNANSPASIRRLIAATIGLTLVMGCRSAGNGATPETGNGDVGVESQVEEPIEEPSEHDAADNAGDGSTIIAAGIEFTVPQGWLVQPRSSAMRAAEYVMPGPAGDASLIVYYFGPEGAGTRDANVKRWVGEYKGSVSSRSSTRPNNDLMLTFVHVSGAFAPTPIDGGELPQPKPEFNTLGVIIESGPHGPLYVKAVGPAATVQAHMAGLDAFIGSARLAPSNDD